MIVYEMWSGKRLVGTFTSDIQILGRGIEVPYRGEGGRIKTIFVPLAHRFVGISKEGRTFRPFLDVRRKSKRQIKILKEWGGR
jgi:hypothetical protein